MKPIFAGRVHVGKQAPFQQAQGQFLEQQAAEQQSVEFGALRRGFERLCRRTLWLCALALALPAMVAAQGSAVPVRVTDRVNLSQMTTLAGNTPAFARAANDQGAAPADLPMNRMMLVLKRSDAQEAALQDLLAQQQVKTSASYRKWLTPDQFGQQFGVADADIQAVTSWLSSVGFQSIQVSRGKTVIEFSGTAAQVQAALHTTIHRYLVNGELHWSNSSDPQIPAALAPVVAGVASLHDFHPKPAIHRSDRILTKNISSGPNPQINLQDQSGNVIHALVPGDFNKIYNIAPTMTGAGVTIGIVADTNINTQDVADFRTAWGLSTNTPTVVLDGPDPGDVPGSGNEGEAVLDATWSGAVAPAATVDLVVSEDTNAAAGTDLSEFYIIDNNLADVMTESFETCELVYQQAGILTGTNGAAAFYSGMAEQAAAQGITFSVASGDGGPDACDDPSTNPTTPTAASVNLLASSWYDVAVSGTEFHDCDPLPGCTDSAGKYWTVATNTNSGNAANGESALSYIPENAWNEACTALSSSCAATGLWSSGGGQSIAFAKPPWQAGVTGIPSTNARFLPDVAMAAANHDGYVLCIDGSCEASPQQFAIASGTSASAQVFGGVMALVVQQMGGRVGNPNFVLYKLAANETYANCNGSGTTSPLVNATDGCIFNDVTSGNTNLPAVSGGHAETGFAAGVGYDETTGLGSVNVSNLVTKWNTAIVDPSTTTLAISSSSFVHGTGVPVGITVAPVSPATGPPTGDVSILSSNSPSDKGIDLFTLTPSGNNGVVIASQNDTFLLPGGTYQVHAHYGGDGKFLGSDSAPVTVTITPEPSEINFGIVVNSAQVGCAASSVTYGSPYILTIDVSDLNASPPSTPCLPNNSTTYPTGTITLTDAFNGGTALPLDGGSFKLNSFGYFEDQTIQLPAGNHTITATYLGDNSFSPPASPAVGTIMVAKAATSISVGASQTAVPSGTAVTLTATIATQSNATASASQEPTGTVQFLLNGQSFGGAVTVTGGVNSGTLLAQATAVLTQTLANGQDVITATYSGDNNYSASGPSTGVTVSVGAPGINVTPATNTAAINILTPGQSGSQAITIAGSGGYSGAVTLTCSVTTAMSGVSDTPTCAFTPGSTITLTTNTTSGQQTLMVNTTAASAVSAPGMRWLGPGAGPLLIGEVGTALVCLLLLGLAAKKRRGAIVLASLILGVLAFGMSCGSSGSGGGGGGNPGTTTGAYSVTVTATPASGTGASTQTTTIAVNVQ